MSEIPEHGREPIPGLPEELPEGERILWQGAPDWRRFAIAALHVRKIAIYFLVLLVFRLTGTPEVGAHAAFVLSGTLAIALLLLLAWLMARSALYTITNRRVVMRFGIALPLSINLPFSVIDAVDLRMRGRTSGDIVIRPQLNRTLSYAVMWPHVRPWRFSPLQPMLRCVPDAREVARMLGDLLGSRAVSANATSAAAQPAENESGQPADGPGQRPFPLPPLLGAAALLVVAIVSVAWVRIAGYGPAVEPVEGVVASIDLRFEDRPDGSVVVLDAQANEIIDELAPGTNNFLRATLRSLVRGRSVRGDVPQDPFSLYQTANGRLLLVDPVTTTHVDLRAFGETNARAFERLLYAGEPSAALQSPSIVSTAELRPPDGAN